MKYVKLDCTRGGLKNPILKIGKKDDEITLEEAQTLVDERMAVEYFPDTLGGSSESARVKELEGKVTALTTANGELKGQLDLLDPKPVVKKS